MLLSDGEIQDLIDDDVIGYDPWDPALLNPASIDMTLHPQIRTPIPITGSRQRHPPLDMDHVEPGHTRLKTMPEEGYTVEPGKFFLACTNECVELPYDLAARVEGKSSVGRVGLAVHITAGFIDPGFKGQVTLEVANMAPWPIILYPGMRIAQIAFERMSMPVLKPYSKTGHYQGQSGPTESRYKI